MGRAREAVDITEKVLAGNRTKFGDEHRDSLSLRATLAGLYSQTGRVADAVRMLRELIPIARSAWGPESDVLLAAENNLGLLLSESGRPEEARELLEHVLRTRREQLGKTHPDTLGTQFNLGLAYTALKRFGDAETTFRELLALPMDVVGERSQVRLIAPRSLAEALHAAGRLPDAEEQFRNALALQRELLPAGHHEIVWTLSLLGENLLQQEDFAASETILQEACAAHAKLKSQYWRQFYDQVLLGAALAGQSQLSQGAECAVTGVRELLQREAQLDLDGHAKLRQALSRVITILEAANRPEEGSHMAQSSKSAVFPPQQQTESAELAGELTSGIAETDALVSTPLVSTPTAAVAASAERAAVRRIGSSLRMVPGIRTYVRFPPQCEGRHTFGVR